MFKVPRKLLRSSGSLKHGYGYRLDSEYGFRLVFNLGLRLSPSFSDITLNVLLL